LEIGDISAKRPGTGIPPNRIGELVGQKLREDVAVDHRFDMKDFA
jgi:sialic acid synthase SpsE